MARKRTAKVLDLAVAFGNLSVGDKTCRIGVSVDRSELSVSQADKNLCERRLSGYLVCKPPGDHPDQETFDGMDGDSEIKGVFDVKSFTVSKDALSLGLTFAVASVNVSALAHFAKRAGRVLIDEVDEIPEKQVGGDNGDDSEETDRGE